MTIGSGDVLKTNFALLSLLDIVYEGSGCVKKEAAVTAPEQQSLQPSSGVSLRVMKLLYF